MLEVRGTLGVRWAAGQLQTMDLTGSDEYR